MAIDLALRLSEHFTLGEMVRSSTASRKGIHNVPNDGQIAALKALCEWVLEPVRLHYERPVIVTSGFRSARLNTAIGGSPSSQHCKGEAADFTVPGVPNLELAEWIWHNLNYDQLIREYGDAGWVHCSWSSRMRNQELTAVKRRGRTVYLPGIVA